MGVFFRPWRDSFPAAREPSVETLGYCLSPSGLGRNQFPHHAGTGQKRQHRHGVGPPYRHVLMICEALSTLEMFPEWGPLAPERDSPAAARQTTACYLAYQVTLFEFFTCATVSESA